MIKIDINLQVGYSFSDLKEAIAARIPIGTDEIREARLLRRTLNLADTAKPYYKCTAAFSASDEREAGLLKIRNKVSLYNEELYSSGERKWDFRPVVVGAGPAGLFAALALAEAGARPIVLERGLTADERKRKIDLFTTLGVLDTECNVQFGEGGAGTFSDGKLKVGSPDKYKLRILYEFIRAGADEEIAFSSSAHLGTDKLLGIITRLREKIEVLGGEFIFGARMTSLDVKDGKLNAVSYVKDGREERLDTSAAIIAIGHSARDSIRMLYGIGMHMEARPFGIGMRLEHKRDYINRIVYRDAYGIVPETASYHLVTHLPSGRSVYSFCMCPGGTVVAATSSAGGIVTNGMSEHARMGENSNAAILVSVTPEDFETEHPLGGIALQEKIERAAYSLSDSYRAPVSTLRDFMEGNKPLSLGAVEPTYPVGTFTELPEKYLPEYVTDSIRGGIVDFDAWMPGYAFGDAVFTGPETRTTSPVRMNREADGTAIGIAGVYPSGEGAGYAGGIVSSARDGIVQAEKLIMTFSHE